MTRLSFDEEVVLQRETPAFSHRDPEGRRRRSGSFREGAHGRKGRLETILDRLEPIPEDIELMLHFFEEIEALRREFDVMIS